MKYIGITRWIGWKIGWLIWTPFHHLLMRGRILGGKNLPPDGPYLILGNHTSALDPPWAAYYPKRHIHFMASAHLFRIPGLRHLITFLNAFPKQKFVKDRQSMASLVERYENGQIIMMFPEGTRTFDGRNIPIRPGIGRLIKKLNARVVFVRNHTGYLIQPRWGKYPRWVPLILEYSDPFTFGEDQSDEEITRVVQEQIRVNPDIEVKGLCLGYRMAWGLENYLWACPECFALSGLAPDPKNGDRIACGACGAAWKVTPLARLVPEAPSLPELTVARAFDRIDAHFGHPPVVDAAALERDGVILRAENAGVGLLERGSLTARPVATGTLELRKDCIRVLGDDGAVRWSIDFSQVRSISVEVRNTLTLISHEGMLQINTGGASPLLWSHFMRHWWWRSDPSREGPVPPP